MCVRVCVCVCVCVRCAAHGPPVAPRAVAVTGVVPDPAAEADPAKRAAYERALGYMGLEDKIGRPLDSLKVDQVFIGSCTNGRIEDMRAVATVVKGKKVAPHLEGRCMVVPGSGLVKEQVIRRDRSEIAARSPLV